MSASATRHYNTLSQSVPVLIDGDYWWLAGTPTVVEKSWNGYPTIVRIAFTNGRVLDFPADTTFIAG